MILRNITIKEYKNINIFDNKFVLNLKIQNPEKLKQMTQNF